MAKNLTSKNITERPANYSKQFVECSEAMRLAVKYAGSIAVVHRMCGVVNGTIHRALNGNAIRVETARVILEFLKKELKEADDKKRKLRSEIDRLKQSV